MAFPAGMDTKTLVISAGHALSGREASLEVIVNPEHDNINQLVWQATGQPLAGFFELQRAIPGNSVVVELPVVDQPGFIDDSLGPVTGWYYKITVRYLLDGRKVGLKTVKYIKPFGVDPETQDFDLLPSGEAPIYRGPQGIEGKDAYEVAVDAGFVGTRAQWLESLRGPAGENANELLAYVHNQTIPSATWTITHPLTFRPAISVADSAGTLVEGDVNYVNAHVITISFNAAFSGTAYLS